MMTIFAFRKALESPTTYFATLGELQWVESEITCSTLFAETKIKLNGKLYLLLMPLLPSSLQYAELFVAKRYHLSLDRVPEMQILRNEMFYETIEGKRAACDMLLEPLPCALCYADAAATAAIDSIYAQVLLSKLHKLRELLLIADISHRAISERNLMIDDQHNIIPIRWYYATTGYGADCEAFETLIHSLAAKCYNEKIDILGEEARCRENRYMLKLMQRRKLSEGLIAVEHNRLWGFADECGRIVIHPKFDWVNDFYEGRAEVVCGNRMGLIDRNGRFIISPKYRIVRYNHVTGCSDVMTDNGWALFDYSGNLIDKE